MRRRGRLLSAAIALLAAFPAASEAPGPVHVAPAAPALRGAAAVVLPTGLLPPDVEARVSRDYLATMDLIYAGRIPEAAARVNALIAAAPDDPRPYLLKARLLREYVSEQDNMRHNVKPQIDPILKILEAAQRNADAILEKDADSQAGLLYRGWTKMFRGQLHELAFEHWSAGRAAKSGKSDLDRVLERDPDNPDALMIVGTYLYFADLLPAVLKIASFILRIPPGDREEGLEYLERAEAVPSYSQHDARGMRGAILFGFEGDLDGAGEVFDAFDARFPDNPRLVEPLAALDLWFADRLGDGLPRVQRVVRTNESDSDPLARELTARLRLYQAWLEIVAGRVEAGRENLVALHAQDPGRPDWFRPTVDLYLADLELLLGEPERARALLRQAVAREDAELARLLAWVDGPDAAASPEEVERLRRLGPVARSIYEGRLDAATAALDELPASDPLVSFYRGEIRTLAGDLRGALASYRRLEDADVPARCRLFRRVARLRRAEIHAELGEWKEAARAFHEEIDRYDVKDMLRHVMRARQRWFEREATRMPG